MAQALMAHPWRRLLQRTARKLNGYTARVYSSQAMQAQQFVTRSEELIAHERQFIANNYKPVPVVVSRALVGLFSLWSCLASLFLSLFRC